MAGHDTDIAILGGGLAGGLVALALAARRPDLRIMLVERDDRLGAITSGPFSSAIFRFPRDGCLNL
jgi:L-2-hydroxyglutarate oxidase LhgO